MDNFDRGDPKNHTPYEGGPGRERMVTSDEWTELLEDAKAFKRKHEKTFRILSDAEGHE